MRLRRTSRRFRCLVHVIPLLWLGIGTGCASRRDQLETGGSPDERRQEIARLDQRIAQAESELGLRPAPAPPPPSAEAELPADMGGEDGGGVASMSPEAPPPAQPTAPMQQRQPPPSSPTRTRFAQPPDAGSSCARVCQSVAAICDAAGRICRLAEDLDDAWATGRCQAATRSCANAEQRAESSCGECD